MERSAIVWPRAADLYLYQPGIECSPGKLLLARNPISKLLRIPYVYDTLLFSLVSLVNVMCLEWLQFL